jgi:class 3 adenylate cyclase
VVRFIDAALIVGAPPTWSIAMVGSGQNGTPKTSAEWLAAVERCERDAELFMAYDLARQGLEEFPDDLALKHRAVLCLASTGAREQAVEIFRRLGLDEVIENPPADIPETLFLDLLTLQARLLKDEAVATCGRERSEKLTRAQELYDAAYRRLQHAGNPGSYYPGINGATLRLLTGDTDGAQALAYQILNDIAAQPIRDKAYYELATELEAQLIVGDVDAAAATARQIITRLKTGSEHDYRALASTIRQLRLVITAKQFAPQTLADLAPPLVIHYLGHIISAPGAPGRFLAHEETAVRQKITECFAERQVGFAYGSLAAGADIMLAEAALEQGAILNVVLPFVEEDFIEISVRPAGRGWVERFERCYSAAATKRFATTDRYLGDDSLFGYCSQLAMGLTLLRAAHICAPVEQIAIWDGKPSTGPSGTAIDVRRWKRSKMPQTIIPVLGTALHSYRPVADNRRTERRTRAMLFGDVHGFSALNDEQLPRFVDTVLGAFGQVVDFFRGDVRLVNTWGDGLFLVFDDAGKAAACALGLQEAMNSLDLAAAGLPETLALRIGGHLGPVYAARDPILHGPNFFGAHVSRAARIEPVTPEKLVYVTETMAAVLALYNADQFDCLYVGMTRAAKDYGEMRMFLLKPKQNG